MKILARHSAFVKNCLLIYLLYLSIGLTLLGEWREDRFEGWGRLRYADLSEYEGDLHQGMRHGQVNRLMIKKYTYVCVLLSSYVAGYHISIFALLGPIAAPHAIYRASRGGRRQHDRWKCDLHLHASTPPVICSSDHCTGENYPG